MTDTTNQGEHQSGSRLEPFVRFWRRAITDLVIVGLWALILTLAFLATGWPRWSFYVVLVLGVLCYTLVTGR